MPQLAVTTALRKERLIPGTLNTPKRRSKYKDWNSLFKNIFPINFHNCGCHQYFTGHWFFVFLNFGLTIDFIYKLYNITEILINSNIAISSINVIVNDISLSPIVKELLRKYQTVRSTHGSTTKNTVEFIKGKIQEATQQFLPKLDKFLQKILKQH